MIDCCERLALILVAGNVIALGDAKLGQKWLAHQTRVHVMAGDGCAESCALCREVVAKMVPDIHASMLPGAHAVTGMRQLAVALSELL
jgi:hypothetical protein